MTEIVSFITAYINICSSSSSLPSWHPGWRVLPAQGIPFHQLFGEVQRWRLAGRCWHSAGERHRVGAGPLGNNDDCMNAWSCIMKFDSTKDLKKEMAQRLHNVLGDCEGFTALRCTMHTVMKPRQPYKGSEWISHLSVITLPGPQFRSEFREKGGGAGRYLQDRETSTLTCSRKIINYKE